VAPWRVLAVKADAMGNWFSSSAEVAMPGAELALAGLESVLVKSVSSVGYHHLVLSTEGVIYSFGEGAHGGLGRLEGDLSAPRAVEGLRGVRVKAVAAGGYHSLALSDHGEVYSFGHGGYGQLGHGDQEHQPTPKLIEGLRGVRVTAIAAGGYHSLVLSDRGALYTFGEGAHGQLGHGEHKDGRQTTPKLIETLPVRGRVTAIAAGGYHSVLLSDHGALYTFGHGGYGQLGHGDRMHQPTPTLVDGLPAQGRVTAMAAGAFHTVASTDRGALFAFGAGGKGQLGLGDTSDALRPAQVTAMEGRLVRAMAAGISHSLFQDNFGQLFEVGWGGSANERTTPSLVDGLKGVRVAEEGGSIAAGGRGSLACASNRRCFRWDEQGVCNVTEDKGEAQVYPPAT
jgi:alpha-tubulin suppressor-like RCC1 family protein